MYKLLVLSLLAIYAVGQMTQTMRDRILRDHNDKRRTATNAANMIELRYDMVLEQVAQAYLARGCAGGFQHNPNRGCDYTSRGGVNGGTGSCASVGENWYSGYPDNTTGVDVVIGGAVSQWTDGRCSSWASPPMRCNSYWCSEKQNFYQTGSDSYGSCGQNSGGQYLHYTQVMWPTTAYVGCSYTAACGTLCNYAQAGNMNLPSAGSIREANVWKIGTPCSTCPPGYTNCNNGLCSATTSAATTRPPTTTTPATTRPPTNTPATTRPPTNTPATTRPPTTTAPTTTPTTVTCAPDFTNIPTNGNIGTCGYRTAVGGSCSTVCNAGYTWTAGSLTRQCTPGGVWASVSAVCSAVVCSADYTTPTNGNFGTCASSTTYGQTCQMACNPGYALTSGSLTRTCGANGALSSVSAVCTLSTPDPPTNAPASVNYTLPTGYCSSGPLSTEDSEFGDVQLVGYGAAIVDTNGCPGKIGPLDLTALSTTLFVSGTYTLNVVRTTCGAYYAAIIGAWIDWDQDGVFEPSELLFPFSQQIGTLSFSFTVPSNAKLGATRMRLQVQEIGSTSTTTIDPCAMFEWGDTKDYTIIVTAGNNQIQCTGDATIKPVNGVAGDCLSTKTYGQSCQQKCNTGYTLASGSLMSTCGASGRYAPSTAVCSATAAAASQAIATTVCLPDATEPVNGSAGTCAQINILDTTCTQVCDPGFTLKAGTSLDRQCTLSGYSPSTAICE